MYLPGDQNGYDSYVRNQLKPGKAWCEQRGILYVPVVFPGFGWYNLRNGNSEMNKIPRDGGDFFWLQAYGAVENKVESVYFAMLDEVDESTAFFKTAENGSQAPAQENWLNLDADGHELPSDWYLRCAGKAAEMLRGNVELSDDLGTPDEGIMAVFPGIDDCKLTFVFPDFEDVSILEFSIDGGETFPYTVADDVGTFEIENLDKGNYNIFVRNTYSVGDPVPMGISCVSSSCIATSANEIQLNSELDNLKIYPNPAKSTINIDGIMQESQIEILDIRGKVCKQFTVSEQNHAIDVSDLPNALYIITIKNNLGTKVQKFTKSN